jgi:hypothetical protein
MESSILSEVDDTSILKTGSHAAMPVLSTGYRPLASCPAQRAGAQRLCALALTSRAGLSADISAVGG